MGQRLVSPSVMQDGSEVHVAVQQDENRALVRDVARVVAEEVVAGVCQVIAESLVEFLGDHLRGVSSRSPDDRNVAGGHKDRKEATDDAIHGALNFCIRSV